MNDYFRDLLDSHPGWPPDVRARIAALGERAHPSTVVEYLPSRSTGSGSAAMSPSPAAAAASIPIARPQAATATRETWITKAHVAGVLGVTTKTVDRWVKQGMPRGGPVGVVPRFLASECVAWASARTAGVHCPPADVSQPARAIVNAPAGAPQAPAPPRAAVQLAAARSLEPWVDVAAVATHLACTERRVRDLAKRDDARRIPHRREGRRLLFKLSKVDRWLDCIGAG